MLHHRWLSIWTFQTGTVDGLEYLPGLELEQVCGEVSRDVRGEAAPPICRLIANNGGSQTGTKWKKIVLVSRENFVFPNLLENRFPTINRYFRIWQIFIITQLVTLWPFYCFLIQYAATNIHRCYMARKKNFDKVLIFSMCMYIYNYSFNSKLIHMRTNKSNFETNQFPIR